MDLLASNFIRRTSRRTSTPDAVSIDHSPRLGIQLVARVTLAICLFACTWHASGSLAADPLGKPPLGKNLRTSAGGTGTYDFSLGSTFDRILNETASTELYDSFTIATLKRMQAEAMPDWDPAGLDPELTRHVAERAFAIQAGRSLVNTLKRSDLKETYRDVVSGFLAVQNALRLTVRDTGSSYSVGKGAKGKKLLELGVEFNLRQFLDPQIRIGKSMRFRYDHNSRSPLVEYGFSF